MSKEEFLERARDKHGYKYQYPTLSDRILSNDDIDILYKGILYKQKVVKHILLGRCPEKNTPTKTNEEYINEAIEVWGNKYDYTLTNYKGALKKIKVIYDGVVYEQSAISHLLYAPEKLLICRTTETFIKESDIVHNNRYEYTETIYNKNNKLSINCKLHGLFSTLPTSHLNGEGCPNCDDYKIRKDIIKYLDKRNISYYQQHKFNGVELPFDFYIPSIRSVIELETNNGKLDYCEDNFIEFIIIKDNINHILNNFFNI